VIRNSLSSQTNRGFCATLALICVAFTNYTAIAQSAGPGTTRVPVVFSGGHETDPRDQGRPVSLIAGALGVLPDVFRDAFSHVHPAPPGTEPDSQRVHANKRVLLDALGRYGITNDRLDEVTTKYRYRRDSEEMWPTTEAQAYALVKNGKVMQYVVTSGGAGYSSPPSVSLPSLPHATARAQISFNSDFEKNGSVTALTP